MLMKNNKARFKFSFQKIRPDVNILNIFNKNGASFRVALALSGFEDTST